MGLGGSGAGANSSSNAGNTQTAGNSSSTNPNGTFNPNGAAGGAAAAANTGTDVYGLNPTEEQWQFYAGINPAVPGMVDSRPGAAGRNHERQGDGVGTPGTPQSNAYDNALKLMRQFAGQAATDPTGWAKTQGQLSALGFYGSNTGTNPPYIAGTWTDADAQALYKAFRSYQGQAGVDGAGLPITFSQYIDQNSHQAAANGQAGGPAAAAPKPSILDDPIALRATVMSAAQASLGRGATEDELNKFVAQFQGAQAAYQQSTDPNTVIAPNAIADASAFAQHSDPQGYANHQAQGYTNAFMNLFLPSSESRSVIQPVASA